MASTEERNARLDKLGDAVSAWADKRRKTLTEQVDFSKRLLRGRTGADRLANASVQTASDLTVDQISDFLTGD